MAYIGREPQVGNFQVCDAISVVNGQAAYTMQVSSVNVSPETANHMLVSLNGVLQAPGSSYTVSGSTITFASNLVTGDVINFIHILGSVLDLGVPSDDTVTLAKLASGTDGNLISYDTSGNPVAVATGNSGQVLTSGGAGAVPTFADAAGGGGLIFIKKITASSDGSISFQNGSGDVVIDGTYDNYVIKFNNVRPADQNKNLNAQIYTGGTIRTSNYGTTTAVFDGAQGGVSNNTNFQDFTDNCGAWIGINNQSEKGLFGEICFSTPTDTSQFFTATYSGGTAYDGAYGRVKSYVGTGGYKTSGTAMDGIKFFFNSGNIAEGIFTLYGMVKA